MTWQSNTTLEELITTTLADIGFRNGNAVFELSWKASLLSIAEGLILIDKESHLWSIRKSEMILSNKRKERELNQRETSLQFKENETLLENHHLLPNPMTLIPIEQPTPSPPPMKASEEELDRKSQDQNSFPQAQHTKKEEIKQENSISSSDTGSLKSFHFDPTKPMIFSMTNGFISNILFFSNSYSPSF
jgi:hypothetical protein